MHHYSIKEPAVIFVGRLHMHFEAYAYRYSPTGSGRSNSVSAVLGTQIYVNLFGRFESRVIIVPSFHLKRYCRVISNVLLFVHNLVYITF